jgi:hypothetical protein
MMGDGARPLAYVSCDKVDTMEGWEPPSSCNVWLLLLSKNEKIYKFSKLKEGVKATQP